MLELELSKLDSPVWKIEPFGFVREICTKPIQYILSDTL
jgi:hypothetical protein